MKDARNLSTRAAALQTLIEAKFGVKSRDLAQALRRLGRRLPRRLRAQGQQLVEAQRMAGNPALARQLDLPALEKAYGNIHRFLSAVDVAARRRERMLNMAALIAFYVLVVAVSFVTWLWWRGYV